MYPVEALVVCELGHTATAAAMLRRESAHSRARITSFQTATSHERDTHGSIAGLINHSANRAYSRFITQHSRTDARMEDTKKVAAQVFAHKIALVALMKELGLSKGQINMIESRCRQDVIALSNTLDRDVLKVVQEEIDTLLAGVRRV